MQQLGLRVVAPRHVGGRKGQHIELVRIFLIDIAERIRGDRIGRDFLGKSGSRDRLDIEAARLDDGVFAALRAAEPDQTLRIEALRRVPGLATGLYQRANKALERKELSARVVPDLGRLVAD